MRVSFVVALVALELWSCSFASACETYDGTLYTDKPPELSRLLTPISIFYVRKIWDPPDHPERLPNKELTRSELQKQFSGVPILVLDVEHWPLIGPADVVNDSVDKLRTLLRWTKESLPGTKVGFYSLIPARDYWRAIGGAKSAGHNAWRKQNDSLQSLADEVDILFPSLYTFYDDLGGWERYLRANVHEARRIANGKPVIAFLWPEFHDSSRFKGRFLPIEMWAEEIRLTCSVADGFVVWGGWDTVLNRRRQWDPAAAWWKAVEAQFKPTKLNGRYRK